MSTGTRLHNIPAVTQDPAGDDMTLFLRRRRQVASRAHNDRTALALPVTDIVGGGSRDRGGMGLSVEAGGSAAVA